MDDGGDDLRRGNLRGADRHVRPIVREGRHVRAIIREVCGCVQ